MVSAIDEINQALTQFKPYDSTNALAYCVGILAGKIDLQAVEITKLKKEICRLKKPTK